MAAIDGRPALPDKSRQLTLAIGGSLILHGVLLAWLPPVVRDIRLAQPIVLEVSLTTQSPVAPAVTPDGPMPAAEKPPAPVVKDRRVAPEVQPGEPVANVSPSGPSDADMPARPAASVRMAEAVLAPPLVPPPEPMPLTPPDVRAAYLSNPRPPYPLAARRRGLEGRVVLRAEILENGTCNHVALERSSGHDILDQAALQAVKAWRFIPARRGAEPVAAWVEVPVAFRLDGGEK